MATTNSKFYTGVKQYPQPEAADIKEVVLSVEMPAVLVANDMIRVARLPAGVRCVDWAIIPTDIDSNGTPTVAWSLGIENAGATDIGAEVWGSALTAGQTNAIVRATNSVAAQGAQTDRVLLLKATTPPATYVAGGVFDVMLRLVG